MIRKNYSTNVTGIIENVNFKLHSAFNKAAEKNHKQAYAEIFTFIQKQLIVAFQKNAREVIGQFIFTPSQLYSHYISNQEIGNYLLQESSTFFHTIATYSQMRGDRMLTLENNLQFDLCNGTISLFHYALQHPDENVLREALLKLKQMKPTDFSDHMTVRMQIIRSEEMEKKTEIRSNSDNLHFAEILHRRAVLSLYAWSVYLYDNNVIALDRLNFLLEQLEMSYHYFEDLVSDIIFIRKNEAAGFLGLSGWDYKERPTGIVFHPPSAYDWILFGAVFYLMRGQSTHYDVRAIVDDDDFKFLFSAVKSDIAHLEQNITKWAPALGLVQENLSNDDGLEIFEERSRKVVNAFEELKIRNERLNDKVLADEELSPIKIKELKEMLYSAWTEQNFTKKLFEKFNVLETVTNRDHLDFAGVRFFLPQFRMMLVESNYQQIYGTADMGRQAGRTMDYKFIDQLTQAYKNELIAYESIKDGLDEGIKSFVDKKFKPNLIIIPPEASYRTNLMELEDFEINRNPDEGIIGLYKGIPIVTFYSANLKDQVIVTNFEKSFKMKFYEGEELEEKRLLINLRPLTKEEIEAELLKPNAKVDNEGKVLTDAEALTRLSNRIFIEIGAWIKISIIDKKSSFLFLLKLEKK